MDKKEQLEEKILKLDKYIQRTRFPIHIDMFYSEEIEEMDKLVDEANVAMDKLVEYFKKVELTVGAFPMRERGVKPTIREAD